MGLLDRCCPKKPKKSLDYIIKWVEDTDKTIKELNSTIEALETWKETVDDNISELVRQAIEDYDWSELPVDALQAKADKVETAVEGHLASLDANGNLVDSEAGIGESIEQGNMNLATCNAVYTALQGKTDKVTEATDGNLAGLDENGNLIDSDYAPSDFAPANGSPNYAATNHTHSEYANVNHNHDNDYAAKDHYHSQITNDDDENAVVRCGVNNGSGKIELRVQEGGGADKVAAITPDNVDNLTRALATPSSAPEDDATKLITSQAVYNVLLGTIGSLVEGNNDPIAFDISGSSLALGGDTSVYAPLFKGSADMFSAEIYVYDPINDTLYKFLGICRTDFDGSSYVTELYIGNYVLVLNKVMSSGVTTITKQYSLSSLLTPSLTLQPAVS